MTIFHVPKALPQSLFSLASLPPSLPPLLLSASRKKRCRLMRNIRTVRCVFFSHVRSPSTTQRRKTLTFRSKGVTAELLLARPPPSLRLLFCPRHRNKKCTTPVRVFSSSHEIRRQQHDDANNVPRSQGVTAKLLLVRFPPPPLLLLLFRPPLLLRVRCPLLLLVGRTFVPYATSAVRPPAGGSSRK